MLSFLWSLAELLIHWPNGSFLRLWFPWKRRRSRHLGCSNWNIAEHCAQDCWWTGSEELEGKSIQTSIIVFVTFVNRLWKRSSYLQWSMCVVHVLVGYVFDVGNRELGYGKIFQPDYHPTEGDSKPTKHISNYIISYYDHTLNCNTHFFIDNISIETELRKAFKASLCLGLWIEERHTSW